MWKLVCLVLVLLPALLGSSQSLSSGNIVPKIPKYKSSYVIVAPSTIRPKMRFRVGVNIVKANAWSKVTAKIKKGKEIVATGWGNFRRGTKGRIVLKLPEDLGHGQYSLKVKSTGGLRFSCQYQLHLSTKVMSLFIQTDKGIYKPGDKVLFRALGLYANLQVYRRSMDISISDPHNDKIKLWVNQSDPNGVVVKDLQLSSTPLLGDWTIEVKTERQSIRKKFQVARYVLPKFHVRVWMPDYVVTSDKSITFSVKAKYTFDKSLNGTMNISFKLVHSYQHQNSPNTKPFKQISLPIFGQEDIALPMDELKAVERDLNRHKLVVLVDVTDNETQISQSSVGEVDIFSKRVKLEFPSINPKTFKPGMTSMAYVKLSQPDGLPVAPSDRKLVISTQLTLEISPKSIHHQGGSAQGPPKTKHVFLPVLELTVPENGLVEFPVPSKANAIAVHVTANYDSLSAALSLKTSYSPSKSFMKILLMTKTVIKAGDYIEFNLLSTQPMGTIQYQTLAKGEIIYTGSFEGNNKKEIKVTLKAISQMAPTARTVFYYVRADGEIVTHSISFDVSGPFRNRVGLDLNHKEVQPGGEIRVVVNADPGSQAYLLAMDQRMLVLASGNDITSHAVYNELNHYDNSFKDQENPGPRNSPREPYPVYDEGVDATRVFRSAGVIVLTDALVYRHTPPASASPVREKEPFVLAANSAPPTEESHYKEPEIQIDLPETWLWTDVKICSNGEGTVITSVPDTMTSWIATGFAVNDYSGFGMPDTPSHLRVFKPFFISLYLPYSIVLGEEVAIQVVIFNYLDTDQLVKVTLESAATFASVYKDCNGMEYQLQKDQVLSVMVKAGKAQSVFFPIVALSLGHIDLQVRIQSPRAFDEVKRQLLVEAPGFPLDYNIPILIDLTENVSRAFEKTIQISLPPNTVAGSQFLRISAIGDLMGPSIYGLEKLLRLPTGCGEQTMLSLAPDVSITQYLQLTNQLSGKTKDKALHFMEKGYQNELNFRHLDGSFSAFRSDKSGSMWLTAFVARVFHQASGHIYVDEHIIKTAVQWMIQRQNCDGSFPEPGRVIHKKMQGQTGSEVSLSAFVFISLMENKDIFKDSPAWQTKLDIATANCLAYLENTVSESQDLYLMTLAVYAFQLADSNQTDALLERLNQKANTADGLVHWHQQECQTGNVGSWHKPNPSRAIDVEMTSYVLLVCALRKDISAGRKMMQWVTQQRNSQGGFSSTQDTVVALNALSLFAELVYSDSFDIMTHVVLDQGETHKFNINHKNALVSQRRETKNLPSEITVNAKGQGMALVEISVFFNVETEIEDAMFDLNITILNLTMNHLVLETCTSWLGDGESSGMVVQEIGIPSGFEADTDSFSDLSVIRKIETENKKVILYFDEITSQPLCIRLHSHRSGLVSKVQAPVIKVYDYYEPLNQVTAFYQPTFLMTSKVCDICPHCQNCDTLSKGLEDKKTPTLLQMDEEKLIELGMNGIV